MVDIERLEQLRTDKGITKSFLALKLGITIQTLKRKYDGLSDFTFREVTILCDILGITKLSDMEKIFNKM